MPTKEQVKQALKLANTKSAYDHFFKKLKSVDWALLLEKEGVFKKPPQVIELNDMLRIPIWEPSRYLARVSVFEPHTVLKIILKIPETNNPRVYEDFIDAAMHMPSGDANKLIAKLLKFLRCPYRYTFPNKLAEFAVFFFKSGCSEEAFKICNQLLDIRKDTTQSSTYNHFFYSEWEYNEKLNLLYSNIDNNELKLRFLKLLCIQLNNCIASADDKLSFVDYSCAWRQEMGRTDEFSRDLKDILINWIIKITCSFIQKDVTQIYLYLLNQPLPIFSRITLYLLEKNPVDKKQIVSLLTNYKLASSTDTWHEYALLLTTCFPLLDKSLQNKILKFISTIPDKDKPALTEKKKYRFYYLIREFLTDKIKTHFDILYKKYGDIENPAYLIYSTGGSFGPTSPIEQDEFDKKSIEEILNYIVSWKPPASDLFNDSIDGLAQKLEFSVSKRFNEYINYLEKLKIENVIYIKAIIRGYDKAISQNSIFKWELILNLLKWAINEKSFVHKNINALSEIRIIVCRLIEKGFISKTNPLHKKMRDDVWFILINSLGDNDPNHQRDSSIKKDDYHLGINSTRGTALECAIQYGLWLMRALKITKGKKEYYAELFEILEKHLDHRIEKSIGVHSIYGRWLPWLNLLDTDWTKINISKIFPHQMNKLQYRYAAWRANLLYTQPYDEIYPLVEEEFLFFTKELNFDDSENNYQKLIEKIIVYYLKGVIGLESKIIKLLYSKNNIQILKVIVRFLCMVTSEEYKKQAIALWSKTLDKCNSLSEFSPLCEFGEWSNLKFLDDKWHLEQILTVLKKAKDISPIHLVMDKLIETSNQYPKKTAEILNLVVEYKGKEWGFEFSMWIKKAEDLLKLLLNTEASEEAQKIINKIKLLGMAEFDYF